MLTLEQYATLYLMGTFLALVAQWVISSQTRRIWPEAKAAKEVITLGGFSYRRNVYYFEPYGQAPLWRLMAYFVQVFSLVLLFLALFPVWKSVDWPDLLWAAGMIGWLGKTQLDLAKEIEIVELKSEDDLSGHSLAVRAFGLFLLVLGLVCASAIPNPPEQAITLFDLLP
jgi:hypothetical protein